jgi:hypothetical protein
MADDHRQPDPETGHIPGGKEPWQENKKDFPLKN